MNVMFDSSTIVASLIAKHEHFSFALPWLNAVQAKPHRLLIPGHGLSESYRTMTSIPAPYKLSPMVAVELLEQLVISKGQLIANTPDSYRTVIHRLAELNFPGGIVFDAVIAKAAEESSADLFVTITMKHYTRLWNLPNCRLVNPLTIPPESILAS